MKDLAQGKQLLEGANEGEVGISDSEVKMVVGGYWKADSKEVAPE